MGQPAARLSDMTAHGSPLAPGIGSPTVLIGGLPAWRGMSAAAAAALAIAVVGVAADIAKASAAATLAASTPGGPAAQANLAKTAVDGAANSAPVAVHANGDLCFPPSAGPFAD